MRCSVPSCCRRQGSPSGARQSAPQLHPERAVRVDATPPTTTLLGSCVVKAAVDGFAFVPLAVVVLPKPATPTYVPSAQAAFTLAERVAITLPEAARATGAVQISMRVAPAVKNARFV